jgi:hypothetical protein
MQNLTQGSIFKVLMKLSLPIMASAFLATAYSITDLAWIGTLGSSAVAGVGAGGMYVWLSQGLSTLARMGGQVPMAQELGKGKKVLICLSGRGDKDIDFVMEHYPLQEYEPEDNIQDEYKEFIKHIGGEKN